MKFFLLNARRRNHTLESREHRSRLLEIRNVLQVLILLRLDSLVRLHDDAEGCLIVVPRHIRLVSLFFARPVRLNRRVTLNGPLDRTVLLTLVINLLLLDHVEDLAHILLRQCLRTPSFLDGRSEPLDSELLLLVVLNGVQMLRQ